MDEATLDETAPQGEPAPEAPSDASSTDPAANEPAPASIEQPGANARTYAGKYQSPDELERAYLESQREASRMAGELSALKRTPEPTPSATPKWRELEAERNKWAQHMRNPNLDESARMNADDQVRLYDREIAYERAKSDIAQQSSRQTAEQELERESTEVLNQFKDDLENQQSTLFQASMTRYQQLLRSGYPDTLNTKALAVTFAAARTGAGNAKAIAGDRSALLKTLNTQAKKAVVTGAGGQMPVKSGQVTGKDIEAMTPKEFAKYERTLLGV